jgi:spore coat polysaccharide biosynthesis protein SpsF
LRTGIIALARMSSSRLPGKALMKIGGRPLLSHVIDRLHRAADDLQCDLIIATSDQPEDDAIASLAQREKALSFRGSLNDVAGRALAAATKFDLDFFVRISADSPFICPEVIATAVHLANAEMPDLTTNIFPRTFPPGMSVEVIKTVTFRKLMATDLSINDREHVTKAFYDRPDDFTIINFTHTGVNLSNINLTVDTAEDFEKATWINSQLGERATMAPLIEIVEYARNHAPSRHQ